jgi:hypothetical protein
MAMETQPKKCSQLTNLQGCQRDKWRKYIRDSIANLILTKISAIEQETSISSQCNHLQNSLEQ